LKRDLKLCRDESVDVVFAPSDTEMYPRWGEATDEPARADARPTNSGFSTYVAEEKLSQGMEGASRPTHFRGVTTVVAKLFNIVLPDVAVFGQKDFQQAAVIERMTRDLNFPIDVIVAPTVRERDGLALSSRNKYLDAAQRKQATVLNRSIARARTIVKTKTISASQLRTDLRKFIATEKLARLDHVEFFDPETLAPVTTVKRGTHMALAVFFGKTRLIDNAKL
jgi:pantoate--beta-alanine ligase